MQVKTSAFLKQVTSLVLTASLVIGLALYRPPKAKAIVIDTAAVATAAVVALVDWGIPKLLDAGYDLLFGTDDYDAFVSDYVSGAGRSTITNSDTGISLPFYLSEDTITSYESLLNNGKLLSFEHGANELAYVLGEYSSSNYGTYRWSEPDVYFISPEFFVSESDAFTFTLNSFNGYGRSLYYSTWTYGVKIQKYIDGSWSDCAQFKPNNTTSFENVEYTTYDCFLLGTL